ncbi:hypothetical protein ONE63_009017 [Megalurothrips usitatus]|uniref:Uncharacterized protein n=1 Tax=Megalurothrips usitatus TaxID=439358 RepID=A0AAV7XME5_9NEOP|nr:hypothetical protein ONE63_009017 [Megalurothrips usitatus]
MYKDANSLYSQYPQLSAFIESKISAERLTEIKDSLTADGKKARTFQSLPFLLNVVTVAKQKKKSFRPSRLEVAESILLCVPTVGDIVPALETRLQKYSLFGLQLGPQAIIVGTEDAHSKSFVRINGVLYQVENATKAVDIAFKSFHALDAKYPEESKREWLFLERAIYGINVTKKGLDPSTSKLIKDFDNFLRKES